MIIHFILTAMRPCHLQRSVITTCLGTKTISVDLGHRRLETPLRTILVTCPYHYMHCLCLSSGVMRELAVISSIAKQDFTFDVFSWRLGQSTSARPDQVSTISMSGLTRQLRRNAGSNIPVYYMCRRFPVKLMEDGPCMFSYFLYFSESKFNIVFYPI